MRNFLASAGLALALGMMGASGAMAADVSVNSHWTTAFNSPTENYTFSGNFLVNPTTHVVDGVQPGYIATDSDGFSWTIDSIDTAFISDNKLPLDMFGLAFNVTVPSIGTGTMWLFNSGTIAHPDWWDDVQVGAQREVIHLDMATSSFNVPKTWLPGVPEPGTWALMLVVLGSIGAVLRQRRLATVSA